MVRLVWLNEALDLMVKGVDPAEIEERIRAMISVENPGADSTRKAWVCVNRIWVSPPDFCKEFHADGLELAREFKSRKQWRALHWGMAIAAYPFVGQVATIVGRQLKLHGSVAVKEMKSRVAEKFGEREFVRRSARYNLSSFADWGVLKTIGRTGVYQIAPVPLPDHARLRSWLAEASLIAFGGTQPLANIGQHPAMFAIRGLDVDQSIARTNPRLIVTREGLAEELLTLQ
jgi:hypothetical protein